MRILLATLVAAAVMPGAAVAHIDVRSGPGPGFLILSVPNESDTSDTVSVAVRLPSNVVRVRQPDVAGWREDQESVPLEPPVRVGGVETATRVRTVTWSGGSLGPGQRADLPIRVWVAAGSPRTGLVFPTVQRYRDGTVARWIGPEGSDQPAPAFASAVPVVAVAAAGATPTSPQQAQPAAPTTTAADGDESSSAWVWVIVAVVVAAGAGAAGVFARRLRRRPRPPTE